MKFIVAIAAAGYFFDSFDIYILSYVLPSIKAEFGLKPQELGLLMGGAQLMAAGLTLWLACEISGRNLEVVAATA